MILNLLQAVRAFVVAGSSSLQDKNIHGRHHFGNNIHSLHAVKRKKKNAKQRASCGGGFGEKPPERKPKIATNDFAVFPALENGIQKTLVSARTENGSLHAMDAEIYQRLDQIYGFPHFNFETELSEDSTIMDLGDLLSMVPEDTSSDRSQTSEPISDSLDKLPPFEFIRVRRSNMVFGGQLVITRMRFQSW